MVVLRDMEGVVCGGAEGYGGSGVWCEGYGGSSVWC